jgi:NAD(P)-dependent dehydrogenase (short-subunit alcohol dehydrogenase family)
VTKLGNKVAILTGGASGIGLATAGLLVSAGAKVVLAGRRTDIGEDAAKALRREGGDVLFFRTDVSKEAEVAALVARARSAFGRVDYLFNNAGIEGPAATAITDVSEDDCDRLLAINLKGVFFAMKHTIPALIEAGGGAIVNTASFVGTIIPLPQAALYGATKAAIISMTRSIAEGYRDQGVRSYAVCPWVTDTAMVDRVAGGQAKVKAQLAGMNPSRVMVKPHEVAKVVVDMLAGVAFHSGDAILVDSGGAVQKLERLGS